jgi:hypothetical protein
MGVCPACSVTSGNRESSESDVVHDHVWLRQHPIVTVARIAVAVRTGHVKHTGMAEGGETVRTGHAKHTGMAEGGETMGGSSCGGELSPGRGPAEMISNGCTYANRTMLIKGVGKYLLPAAQAWRLGRPGPPVAAPDTGRLHP